MASWQQRLAFAALVAAVLSAILAKATRELWYLGYGFLALFTGLVCLMNLAVSLFSLHAASMKPAASHSTKSLTMSYLLNHLIFPFFGKYSHNYIMETTKNPQKFQDEVLMKILRANCDTVFGRDYKLSTMTSRQAFVKAFPLTTFSHFEKYVERVADGEENVMTKDKVFHLSISSGTTGKNKMYPLTNADANVFKYYVGCVGYILNQLQEKKLNRDASFRLSFPMRKSKGGINIGGMSSARPFKNPDDVMPELNQKIYKEEPSYFVQAVFGLKDPDVGQYQGFSSDLTYSFFNSIEHNKIAIHKAIATGHIQEMPGLDEEIRQELNQMLSPDPERANEILEQLEKGPERLALRLWPKLKYAMVCRGGGFAHTAGLLEKTYLKDVKFCMGGHFGTEGFYGVSLSCPEALQEIFTFLPFIVFLEFIKVEDMETSNPKTYLLEELEVGQLYELVVTNSQGLYRNRFGDVVEIVGYNNNTPKYVFQYRTGQILNCGLDRTPEKALFDAIMQTEKQLNIQIESYTSVENVHLDAATGNKSLRNHYVVFFELQDQKVVSQEHEDVLETNLQNTQESYAGFRNLHSLDPIKVIQVKNGTFNGLRHILLGGKPNQQFKLPRVLRKTDALKYLWEQRLTT